MGKYTECCTITKKITDNFYDYKIPLETKAILKLNITNLPCENAIQ